MKYDIEAACRHLAAQWKARDAERLFASVDALAAGTLACEAADEIATLRAALAAAEARVAEMEHYATECQAKADEHGYYRAKAESALAAAEARAEEAEREAQRLGEERDAYLAGMTAAEKERNVWIKATERWVPESRALAAEARAEEAELAAQEHGLDWSHAVDRAKAAEASLAECREVLREVEWQRDEDESHPDWWWCPSCRGLRVPGHVADCRLARALSADPGET